jgi:hypothetical protein
MSSQAAQEVDEEKRLLTAFDLHDAEGEVRTGLPTGGRGIRTLGPSCGSGKIMSNRGVSKIDVYFTGTEGSNPSLTSEASAVRTGDIGNGT